MRMAAGEAKSREEPQNPSDQLAWGKQIDMVRSLYHGDMWQILSPELVLTFWSLSYGDIFFPGARQAAASPSPEQQNQHLSTADLRSSYDSTAAQRGPLLFF